jgi:hypothetical protein
MGKSKKSVVGLATACRLLGGVAGKTGSKKSLTIWRNGMDRGQLVYPVISNACHAENA